MIEIIEGSAILDQFDRVHFMSRPARHHHVIYWMKKELAELKLECHQQGFITNQGRFVSRQEAAILAIKSEQIVRMDIPGTLFSEDVWDRFGNTPERNI